MLIPNDDVKVEAVKCLFHVPLEEFDHEEIGKIIKLMSSQNIGAGRTEIVLSYIFWILTKLMRDSTDRNNK